MGLKKKLLAVACLALPAAAAPSLASAQTSVKLYGLYDAFVGYTKSNGASKVVVDSSGMSTSYWGVGGSEDLGGGLKAVFAAEAFIRNDTGQAGRYDGDPYFARNSYVGLSGNFGQVLLGRNTTPYFLSTIIFNPFADSFTFSPMVLNTFIGGGNTIVQGDTGTSNSIRYTTPAWNGLSLDVVASAGSELATGPRKQGRMADVALFYFNGPWSATAVVRKLYLDPSEAVSSNQLDWQLGGAYDFGAFKLYAQYQQLKLSTSGADDAKTKTGQIGVSVKAGAGNVLASYVRTKYENMPDAGEKRNTGAIGYDYFLSKRTDVYAMLYMNNVSSTSSFAGDKDRTLGLGIRHQF